MDNLTKIKFNYDLAEDIMSILNTPEGIIQQIKDSSGKTAKSDAVEVFAEINDIKFISLTMINGEAELVVNIDADTVVFDK